MGTSVEEFKGREFRGNKEISPQFTLPQLKDYFKNLFTDHRLEIFSVEVDRETILEESEDERIVRIEKGGRLVEFTGELKDDEMYIIKNSEIGTYMFYFKSKDPTEGSYRHCCYLFRKIRDDFDIREIKKWKIGSSEWWLKRCGSGYGRIDIEIPRFEIPKEVIITELFIKSEETTYSEKGEKPYHRISLLPKGEKTKFLEEIYNYFEKSEN